MDWTPFQLNRLASYSLANPAPKFWRSQDLNHLENHKHSQTEMSLVFHCRLNRTSCFFCLSPPFSSLNFLFLLSLRMHLRTRHVSANFRPFCFLIFGKPTAWLFNSLLNPGDQTKKLGMWWRHTYFTDVNIYIC